MVRMFRAVCLLAVLAPVLASCSGSAEQPIVSEFFNASRLRDSTALARVATVMFDPRTQGTVTSLTITTISPEERKPLPLKALVRTQDDVKAEDEAFSKRKEEYQHANIEAIQRVIRAEQGEGAVAGKDAEVQATWTKLREDSAAMAKKVSDSRRTLRSTTQFIDSSINAGRTAIDVSKYDGEVVSKDVTVSAPVRMPDGKEVQKTLIITMQQAILKGEKETTGRWIITGFKDPTSTTSPATPQT